MGVSVRRLLALQMQRKKILQPPQSVSAAGAMTAIRNDEQIEILIGADEGIDEPISALRRNVLVHLTDDEHECATEFRSVLDIRAFGVLEADRIPHPLLVPGSFIHAVIVTTTIRNGRLVKFRMKDHGGSGVLPACGSAHDAYVADVIPRIFGGGGFVPEDT